MNLPLPIIRRRHDRKRTDAGNGGANSITAMGADQLTVGSALNVLNVTYDVWTITTGLVTP